MKFKYMSKISVLSGIILLNTFSVHAQTAEDYYNNGIANVQKNNFKQAVSDFSTAIEIRTNYATAYYARAYAYYDMNEYTEALADVQETEKLGIPVDSDFKKALENPPATDKKNNKTSPKHHKDSSQSP